MRQTVRMAPESGGPRAPCGMFGVMAGGWPLTREPDARPMRCPRCGTPLSYDPGTGLWYCSWSGCGAVAITAPAPGAPGAAPQDSGQRTAGTAAGVGSQAAPIEPEEERRPRRVWRVLVALGAVVTAVAVVSMGLSPALWSGRPALSVSPHELVWDEGGSAALLPLAFSIQNGGRGRLDWNVECDAPWVTLSPLSGTLDSGLGIVTASVDVTSLSAGTHTAVCTVAAAGAHNSPQTVDVVLTVRSTVESRAIAEAMGDSVEVIYGEQPPYVADPFGSPILLVNRESARDVTWSELVEFLLADPTDESPYVPDERMCGTFAELLHNNAEEAGIRAAWVSLDLRGREIGHALNAFVTTDRGLVFVDSTGDDPSAVFSPDARQGECECDRVAYVRVGSEYGLIPVDRASDFSYETYVAYSRAWDEYLADVATFNALVEEYNTLVRGRTLMAGSEEARRALRMRSDLDARLRDIEMQRELLGPCRWTSLGIVEYVRLYW